MQNQWTILKRRADAIGLSVQMRALNLKALEEERENLLDRVEALNALVEKEDRDFDEDEQAEYDSIMNLVKNDAGEVLVEKSGELAKIELRIERAKQVEADQKRIARARRQQREQDGTIDTTVPHNEQPEPRVYQRIGRLKAFKGENAARDAFNTGMFLRSLKARKVNQVDEVAEAHLERINWNIKALQTEGTSTDGGYLVPEPLSSTIIDVREEVGIARRIADVVPMTSDSLGIPKRTGGLTVYAPGEGKTITASDMTFGKVKLIAEKRAVANQISSELTEDALVNMTDRAVNEMAYALALEEDEELINGDGTSTYFGEIGLLSALGSAGVADALTGHDTWLEIDMGDIGTWFGTLPSKYWQRGRMAILCSTNFYHTVLFRLLAQGGGNTIASLQAGEVADAQFLGYPVFFTDRMPNTTAASTVSALFGNFNEGVMFGDRTGVRIGMSMDYAFLDDVMTLRATSRYDINVHDAGDSSDAGAFVGLKTAS